MSVSAILVTGFLGTGKTTFITTSILPALDGRRFALLVNDFGEINFDGRLFRKDGLDVVEIEGGCICCTAGAQMQEALARIRYDIRPEVLVVEGSGVADPYPLIEALETEGFHIEGIPCLVDPRGLEACQAHAVFGHQVEASNLFVLTKCDMASAQEIAIAEDYLRAAKGDGAGIWRAMDGAVDSGFLDCLGHVSISADHGSGCGCARHRHHGHRTADGFSTVVLRPDGAFRKVDFQRFLSNLPPSVLRLKGVCQFVESLVPLAVNWSFGYSTFTRWEQADEPFLVVIGRNIAEFDMAALLPATEAYHYQGVADLEMMPDWAFDRRPGTAYFGGSELSEVEVAEAALDVCLRDPAGITVVVDPRRLEATSALRHVFQDVRPLTSYRYCDLIKFAEILSQDSRKTVVHLGILSAAAAFLASVSRRDSIILSESYVFRQALGSLGGVAGERANALISCLTHLSDSKFDLP